MPLKAKSVAESRESTRDQAKLFENGNADDAEMDTQEMLVELARLRAQTKVRSSGLAQRVAVQLSASFGGGLLLLYSSRDQNYC